MGSSISRLLGLLCLWAASAGLSQCQDQSFTITSFSRPQTWLRPYDWTYIRVELPSWFSSMRLTIESDAEIDKDHVKQFPKTNLPLICFKDGSPPLPDISDSYLYSSLSKFLTSESSAAQTISAEECIPFQKNITMTFTNEQISSGVWYFGFFNGLGPARTQSKMINRGHAYMFSTDIIIQGCPTSTIWGPYCNQSVGMILCSQSSLQKSSRSLLDGIIYNNMGNLIHLVEDRGHLNSNFHLPSSSFPEQKQVVSNSSISTAAENFITCNNSIESSCINYGEFKFYFLDIINIPSQFTIAATNLKLNKTSVNSSAVLDGVLLMCYARYNVMPLVTSYDHSSDISRDPLIVKSPRIGRWYIAVQAVKIPSPSKTIQGNFSEANICFSFDWQLYECLNGKAGLNCKWEAYMLQRVPRRGSSIPSDSYYLPIDKTLHKENGDTFPLDYLLTNSSDSSAWTYLFLDVPHGASGANMHVRLVSEEKLSYEIYSKFGGLASNDTWDYYVNSTKSSNGSTILVLGDSSERELNFYILYPREGIWCFGLKHPSRTHYTQQTTMSITLEGCPNHCSSSGQCHYSVDGSGLTFYSYCACDRDHGGFDCSKELVSREGHIWQSIFLIASNAAAVLPAFWALRQKAFAEWVLFTASGVSSGLYHACDVGTWCVLSFRVLQFMDFWLSFMAVVSTFVYMATIDDASKRAIHTVVSIVTALLAVTGATRSENIVLVIAIGILGLLIGWLLEFSTSYRSMRCPFGLDLNMNDRWRSIRRWFWNLISLLNKRFCWPFVLLGFLAVAFAATSWTLESSQSYWIWHSLWHISMYTSSFFFLCSLSTKRSNETEPAAYELTRQDSSSRLEQ